MILALVACTGEGVVTRPIPSEVGDSGHSEPPEIEDTSPPEPEDPGYPELPETVDVVHVTLAVADVEFAGTDDTLRACFSAQDCLTLAKPDWDDNERGQIEVHVAEGFGMARGALDRFTIAIDDGGDRFQPTCAALSLDGEPVSCQPMDAYLGSDASDELPLWQGELALACQGCFPSMITHGPWVGASGQLWFRTDATRRVVVSVGATSEQLWPRAIVYPTAAEDFTVQVDIGRGERWVQLEVDGVALPPQRFLVPETLERFAFGSCSKTAEQPAWAAISAWEPELFLFIGDNHYANSDDLGALRSWYRWSLEVPGRTEAMQGTAVLATWDDHDFTGNNTDGTEPGRDVALRAFREYWANPSYGSDELAGVFTTLRVGDAEFFVVDDRYWRGFDDSLLGAAQQAWLVDAVRSSDAHWKLVACGSQWTSQGSGDSWAVFDQAREALFAELTAAPGVVLLSGDIHRSELRLLSAPGYDLPELTSSPLANSTSTCKSSEELIACYDDGPSWVGVELSSVALTATIFDESGQVRASWTIQHAELQ